jgi:hypothetical protein
MRNYQQLQYIVRLWFNSVDAKCLKILILPLLRSIFPLACAMLSGLNPGFETASKPNCDGIIVDQLAGVIPEPGHG